MHTVLLPTILSLFSFTKKVLNKSKSICFCEMIFSLIMIITISKSHEVIFYYNPEEEAARRIKMCYSHKLKLEIV